MIIPVNGHLVIDPIKHEGFITSQNDQYEEIGVVIALAETLVGVGVGDKVYFDSWLAARYPKPDAKDGEYYWLVKWDDVRALQHAES